MFSLNVQPIEKRSYDQTGAVEVSDVFYTIQGEGPFAGCPAVFVRLAGCNLQCPGCDTDYTSRRKIMSPNALLTEVYKQYTYRIMSRGPRKLVVITGGEPFRQNLTQAVEKLLSAGFQVQIETNGTIHDPDFCYDKVEIVVSPKTGINPYYRTLPNVSFKYVGRESELSPYDGLPTQALLTSSAFQLPRPWADLKPSEVADRVYLQPMDEGDAEKNQANLKACAESCMRYGYKLSVQLHKIVGLK